MKTNYEEKLQGLTAYVQELKTITAKFGTSHEQFESDLMAAEQNIKYYQAQIAETKGQSGEPAKSDAPKGGVLPATAKQGIGSIVFSSITFAVGALLGSKLKSRKDNKDSN